jgi:hypothetical protein
MNPQWTGFDGWIANAERMMLQGSKRRCVKYLG